jgi:hypothetical protein
MPGNSLEDLRKFYESDLDNQAKQAKASAISDASARGVYYGTPLTGSEADIDTQLARGKGQFRAGMFGNQQQDVLSRLQLAAQLMGQNASGQPPMPGGLDLSGIGSLFANNPAPYDTSAARTGPAITPQYQKAGGKIEPKKTTD